MVNLYLKLLSIFFIFNVKNSYAGELFKFINNRTELLLIFMMLGFIFIVLLFYFIYYILNSKRENTFRLYLNLENMWNSSSMLEARQKAAQFITDDLLHSKDTKDKESLHYSKVIIDFFNHIGLQVYQNIIDFGHIYNSLSSEILNYWDDKNYKLLVHYEKHKKYPTDMSPWVGFEYLADVCLEQKEYLRGVMWVPASYPPMSSGRVQEKIVSSSKEKSNFTVNIYLIVFSFLAFISFVVFLLSYLFYYGYV